MTLITKKQKEYATIPIAPNKPLPLAVALADDTEYKKDGDGLNGEEFVYHDYSEDGLHVSEEVYWKYYYEHPYFNYEWNNGVLEEKPVSNRITYNSYAWFCKLLQEYLTYHPIGETIGLETGGRIALGDETSIRKPDFAVILTSNPVPYEDLDNSYKGTFDMVVEAISVSTEDCKKRDTVTKKREYALGGVKEYYILDGEETETKFYYLNEQRQYEEIVPENGIIKSKVLPNFQFRVTDLYEKPPLQALIDDDIYSGFVGLAHQADRKRAEAEAQARQQAEQRAQAAEAEIERLKALLKNISSE